MGRSVCKQKETRRKKKVNIQIHWPWLDGCQRKKNRESAPLIEIMIKTEKQDVKTANEKNSLGTIR